jgi:hypothetical protein
VERGGGLVATHETSLYDEWGKRRKNFGLADVFGAAFEGTVEPRMQNSYIHLNHPHPLLKGLEDAPRIVNGVARVHTRSLGGKPAPMTLIPSYPDLPMEDVYPRVPTTNIPVVHIAEVGRGRVVYFPWDIDRTFWEVLSPDHLALIRNAVDWVTNEPRPVNVTGPGIVDIAFWRQKSTMTLHLVNLTNPMMMKGPIREIYPVGQQLVRATMPEKTKVSAVRLCVANTPAQYRMSGNILEVEVPSVRLHEMIAIDFA